MNKIASDLFSLFLPGPIGKTPPGNTVNLPMLRKPTSYQTRLHYWVHINRAQMDGNHSFAESILKLYRQQFPTP